MDVQTKKQVMTAAKRYITDKGMTQNGFAKYCDVNPSYLSNMLNGVFEYKVSGDKNVGIPDKYFEIVAESIGMSMAATFWKMRETPQFVDIVSALDDAKRRGVAKMIIGDTGCGKTYSTNKFREANPLHTYRITVSNQHKIQDVTGELGAVLDLRLDIHKSARMKAIAEKLRSIKLQGGRPLVIIDEAENMTHGMIGLCKGLYDAINEYCGFVLIGTSELEDKLNHMQRYGYRYSGIPQFRRRFKAGTIHLEPVAPERHFKAFLSDVPDARLRNLLCKLCDNYGELYDFLEHAMQSAARDGQPLTDEYFRTMYKIA